MFKRVASTAGNPLGYAGYVFPLFILYLLYNLFLHSTGPLPETVQTIAGWVYMLLLNPFILAGLYGAINEQQKTRGETGIGEFLPNAWRHYWRMAVSNLIYVLLATVLSMVIAGALHANQPDQVANYIDVPASAIALFWSVSIVAEGGLFASLGRGLKVMLRNPLALALGLLWGLFRFADSVALKDLIAPSALTMNAVEAALVAVARVLAAVYAVALYRQTRGEALEAQEEVAPEVVQAAANRGLLNASIGFGVASFLPVVHLVALALGIAALKRNKAFSMRAVVAVGLGAFFTAFYALLLAGGFVARNAASPEPGYWFLVEENPGLLQQVTLLEKESYKDAQAQLVPLSSANSSHDWTVDTALALAKWGNSDLDGALESFYAAAQQKPDRSEFYYQYGRALLANDENEMATEQFQNAAAHTPVLQGAGRYVDLLSASYTPPQLVTAAFSIIILLFLFTVHEYGHAYMAWKLGDDTAKNLGRLTLSPIAHLDLFGSILLPGILLFRGSDVIFGWAKPVPVNPANFKNPRKDHMRVAFAGPAVNILVAMICFVLLAVLALILRLLWPQSLTWDFAAPYGALAIAGPPFAHQLTLVVIFIRELMYMSLVLGFFNLLPIPPLDGSWILAGLLPERMANTFVGVGRYLGYALFLLLILTPVVSYYVSIPVGVAWNGLYTLISVAGLG